MRKRIAPPMIDVCQRDLSLLKKLAEAKKC